MSAIVLFAEDLIVYNETDIQGMNPGGEPVMAFQFEEFHDIWSQADQKLGGLTFPMVRSSLTVEILRIQYIYQKQNSFNNLFTHRHTYYELHLLLEGAQPYRFHEESITLQPGELLMVPSGLLHETPNEKFTYPLRKFALLFNIPQNQPEYKWVIDALAKNEPLIIRSAEKYEVLFRQIMQEAAESKAGWIENVHHLISVLIVHLAREGVEKLRVTNPLPLYHCTETERRVNAVERYIRDNLDMNLDCSALAASQHICVRQLNRNVQKERGISLRELINNIKYEVACHKLLDKQKSVSSIGKELGFADESSFNRFFKRCSGSAPREWRKQKILTEVKEEKKS